MIFSDPVFLFVFLPLLLVLLALARRFANLLVIPLLAILSLVFYAYWDWRYVPLIVTSVVINYFLGILLQKKSTRTILLVGLAINLLVLALFKYTDFILQSVSTLTDTTYTMLNLALPLAISFFTFQQIAYLVDCYRGRGRPYRFTHYLLFVTFFPQLIAGPIVHHHQIIPQYARLLKKVPPVLIAEGLFFLIVGLFKKVIIADNLAKYVDPAFSSIAQLDFLEAWTAIIAYTLQLYFDFSAYCEMAIGIALLFGIRLPINFNSPYQAISIQDFWRRWHITLGRFFRDYVYFPLGGNRNGIARTMLAVMITFLLAGLWHGAGWQYVIWGGFHGLMLVCFMLWQYQPIRLPKFIALSLTFVCVMLAWVMFRADSVESAFMFYQVLFGAQGWVFPEVYRAIPGVGALATIRHSSMINGVELWVMMILVAWVMSAKNVQLRFDTLQFTARNVIALIPLIVMTVFSLGQPSSFLYFQF